MMDFKGVEANEGASKAYEFDINLFDGRDMDVIAVNAADYKQLRLIGQKVCVKTLITLVNI